MKYILLILLIAFLWFIFKVFILASRIKKEAERFREANEANPGGAFPNLQRKGEKDISNRVKIIDEKKSEE